MSSQYTEYKIKTPFKENGVIYAPEDMADAIQEQNPNCDVRTSFKTNNCNQADALVASGCLCPLEDEKSMEIQYKEPQKACACGAKGSAECVCKSIYVAYDSELHADGAPVVGDGTDSNPFQTPIPLSTAVTDPVKEITTTTHPDGTSHSSCDNPVKSIRDNGDGTYTAVKADGTDGETIDFPTTGETQLSVVDANGDTTYIDADGNTQTVPATDADGNPVDPSQGVWNLIDGNGNYLGSKPCKDETVLSQNASGVVDPVDPATGNQTVVLKDGGSGLVGADGRTINPIFGKNGAVIDVPSANFMLHSDGPSGAGISGSPVWCDDSDDCKHRLLDCDGNVVKEWKKYDDDNSYEARLRQPGEGGWINTVTTGTFLNVLPSSIPTTDAQQGGGGIDFPTYTNPYPCPVKVYASMTSLAVTLEARGGTVHESLSFVVYLDSYSAATAYRGDMKLSPDGFNIESWNGSITNHCVATLQPGESYTPTLYAYIYESIFTTTGGYTIYNREGPEWYLHLRAECI